MSIVVRHLGKISVVQSGRNLVGLKHFNRLRVDPVRVMAHIGLHLADIENLQHRNQDPQGNGELLFKAGGTYGNFLPKEKEKQHKACRADEDGDTRDGKGERISA